MGFAKRKRDGMKFVKTQQSFVWHHGNVDQEMGILTIEQQGGLQLEQTRIVVNQ